jgi:hypothetical protein
MPVRCCDLLELIENGDDVMGDKELTLCKILSEREVSLNIPAFVKKKANLR